LRPRTIGLVTSPTGAAIRDILDDDVIDAHRERGANFAGRFVVAVQIDFCRVETDAPRNFQLDFGLEARFGLRVILKRTV
jgi:hypothetical protein